MAARRAPRRLSLFFLCLLGTLPVIGPRSARAETAPPRSLSLAEAIDLALRTDPQVQSAQATAEPVDDLAQADRFRAAADEAQSRLTFRREPL